jgi:hypothetical protein
MNEPLYPTRVERIMNRTSAVTCRSKGAMGKSKHVTIKAVMPVAAKLVIVDGRLDLMLVTMMRGVMIRTSHPAVKPARMDCRHAVAAKMDAMMSELVGDIDSVLFVPAELDDDVDVAMMTAHAVGKAQFSRADKT